tara:strand:- start:2503 stop:2625 length:123 start_codon:yes stop_codon:yes gene_type:complete
MRVLGVLGTKIFYPGIKKIKENYLGEKNPIKPFTRSGSLR